jgi:hypothetical protein
MVIKYESRFHSEDDPGGLIREVLEMGSEFPGPSQDILLAWMLRIDDGRDPAMVAARLLSDYGVAEGPLPEGACGELVKLLRETARCRAETLQARGSKRQGRRRDA